MAPVGILVVAGDAGRRERTARSLRDAGFHGVVSTSSVEQAVGAIRRGRVGCAVVWDRLDDLGGLHAVRILLAAQPRLKIVFAASEPDAKLEAGVRELPILYYHVEEAGEADLLEAVAAAVGRPREPRERAAILVVDDDEAYTVGLRAMLEAEGYRVWTARSAAEGLQVARKERPDAILVDIVMNSATDGLQFCHEARRDPLLMHTPIAAVSAISKPSPALFPAGTAADGDDLLPVDAYLEKPLDLDRLLVELRKLLDKGD